MTTRRDVINFCKKLDDVYEDYPFRDDNWTIMRHRENKKMFAAIYERQGKIWLNIKCNPNLAYMWRSSYKSVVPAYHMNKVHWNSIILDGDVPEWEVKNMIADSYDLTKGRKKGKGRMRCDKY